MSTPKGDLFWLWLSLAGVFAIEVMAAAFLFGYSAMVGNDVNALLAALVGMGGAACFLSILFKQIFPKK